MDDLLREFLTETNESLDVVDEQLIRFGQDPNNANILDNIFRLVHTIKGTCGFLGLPRLEALAHAAETLMGQYRDGLSVTEDAFSLIQSTIERIKEILNGLEPTGTEPDGADQDLIGQLERMSVHQAPPVALPVAKPAASTVGTLTPQVLEQPLRPGEVSLDELERAFRETPRPEIPMSRPGVIAKVAIVAEDAVFNQKPKFLLRPSADIPSLRILVMRHAEMPIDDFNPDLSPAGYERAERLATYIPNNFGKPNLLFAAALSRYSRRPYETLKPLSKAIGVPIDGTFADQDYGALAHELMASVLHDGSLIVICWHHGNIPSLAHALNAEAGDYPDPWDRLVFNLILQFDFQRSPRAVSKIIEPF